MKKTYFIVLLLASVVLVSACVQQRPATADANNGLTIKEFTADPLLAEPTDFVNFFLQVENVGGTTASCIRTQLLNVDSWRALDGTTISRLGTLGFSNLQLTYSGFQGQTCVGSYCYSTFNFPRQPGTSFTIFFDQVFTRLGKEELCRKLADPTLDTVSDFREELLPPDKARNKAGELFTADFTLLPPTLPEGIQSEFRPTVRVAYIYKTTGQIKIPVYTRAEFRRRQDLGQPIDTAVIDNTDAPIKITASRTLNPIIVNTDPNIITDPTRLTERATFVLELQNVGDGFPTPAEFFNGKQGGFIFGTVILRGAGASFHDCLGVGPGAQSSYVGLLGDQGEIVLGENSELLRMRSDNRAPFGCTIALDRQTWQSRPFGTVELVFNLFYVYFVDQDVSVKVLGEESGGISAFK